MSYPEDRVLIGVIQRVQDLTTAEDMGWYRIPVSQFPEGIDVEYLGLFISRRFGSANGAVQYYAQVRGIELVYRKWLIPTEPNHPRANDQYYKLVLGSLIPKLPAIVNTQRRRFAFIRTTWDRFSCARSLQELASEDLDPKRSHHVLFPLRMQVDHRILPDDQLYF